MTESDILTDLGGDQPGQMTTDEAFQSALKPNILGLDANGEPRKLYPFSLQRKTMWGELIGQGGSLNHWSILIAWVCSRTREELWQANSDRARALEEAYVWAEENGISVEDPTPAIKLFEKIDAELFASTQAKVETEGPERPNSGGQPEC